MHPSRVGSRPYLQIYKATNVLEGRTRQLIFARRQGQRKKKLLQHWRQDTAHLVEGDEEEVQHKTDLIDQVC